MLVGITRCRWLLLAVRAYSGWHMAVGCVEDILYWHLRFALSILAKYSEQGVLRAKHRE